MTIKIGDLVKFTKNSPYRGFQDMGITGKVVDILTSTHWAYGVSISVEDQLELIDKGFLRSYDPLAWPCSAEEIELVLPEPQE